MLTISTDAWANLLKTHAYVSNYAEAAVAGLNAGLDMEGTTGPVRRAARGECGWLCKSHAYFAQLYVLEAMPGAVGTNSSLAARVTAAFRRLFRVRLRLGMLDPPTMVPYNKFGNESILSPAHQLVAETAAAEGFAASCSLP